MNKQDIIEIGIKNLTRRKARTILSIIGVFIGTTAIIVMLSLGIGLSQNQQKQVEKYANLHLINIYRGGGRGTADGGKPKKLDEAALKEIGNLDGIKAVSPVINKYVRMVSGKYVADVNVNGIRLDTLEAFNFPIAEGRFLHKSDKNEMLIGNQIPSNFYNPKKQDWPEYVEPKEDEKYTKGPVNIMTAKFEITGDMSYGGSKRHDEFQNEQEDINYKNYSVKPVAVLADKNGETSYNVYMDYEALKKIVDDIEAAEGGHRGNSRNSEFDNVIAYADDITKIDAITKSIRDMGFEPSSANDWLNQVKEEAKMIQAVLGGIGAISLLVAAIGITNTMIMSIYERTREIGVMKVIGADLKDIKKLFLFEAAMIGFFGGLVGVAFSYLCSYLINKFSSGAMMPMFGMGEEGASISVIPITLSIAALIFSTLIGVVSGYYPANRAMKISALESLKNE